MPFLAAATIGHNQPYMVVIAMVLVLIIGRANFYNVFIVLEGRRGLGSGHGGVGITVS